MKTHKWIIAAGAITLAGCEGGAEPSPAPAGGTAVAAKPGNSAASARKQAEWVAYNSQDGGFSVLLPATPEVTAQPGSLFTTHTISCNDGGITYMLTYFDPPPRAIAPEVVEATLKRDRDSGVRDINGTLKSEEKITIRKDGKDWFGIASVMENSSNLYNGRQFATEKRVYGLQASHPKNEDHSAEIKKFFDSFKLSDGAVPK